MRFVTLEGRNVAFQPHPKSFYSEEGLSKRRNQKLPLSCGESGVRFFER
jgi:hypothetical protein